MRVFFEQRHELVPGIWQYDFRPEARVDFVPGQYLDLILPGVTDDARGAARTFTLTSLPQDKLLSFVVKIPSPHSQYKAVLMALAPGDPATITDAMGDLVLPKDSRQPLVFIAGGIGMASYASMLKELLTKREERAIFLFYELRDRREQIFRDITEAYPLALKTLAIAPNRLSAQQVRATTPPESLMYISGSQRFVERLRTQFEQLGVPRSRIVFDYFDGYAEL